MKKALILVEGQTEETFIRDVLGPYLLPKTIYLQAKLATTKRVKKGPDFKGGIVSYGKMRSDLLRLLGDTSAHIVTTMIDFYGLPPDFPGKRDLPSGTGYERVTHLEEAFRQDINHPKFIPYLSLHEFEAMLFTNPEQFAQAFPDDRNRLKELAQVKAKFGSPEEIDDQPQTAPSKRILHLFPEYQKPIDGSLIILEIGINPIRQACPHFNEWLKKLEAVEED